MKIFGSYTSPYVRHCRIALAEAGLSCEFIETDQAGSAVQSPTQRVPFLEDGDVFLTDSGSILKYIREKSGKEFLPKLEDYDFFCMVNTVLDTTANLFFLQRDGVDINAYIYTKRQAARIESALAELNEKQLPSHAPYSDAQLRLACYLAWAVLRNRIQIEKFPNLKNFLAGANNYSYFKDTAPPQA